MDFKFIGKDEYLKRIQEFQNLFINCFNREITKEFLIWRYISNPIDDIFVNVALENNKIIANYSVSPCRVCINGNIEKLGLSMTTMTHPCFSGRGLFTKLANEVYERMEKCNYKAVIGFPNNNSHFTFIKKLQWKDIYEIPTMKLDLMKGSKFNTAIKSTIINDKTFQLDYSLLTNKRDNKIKVYKDLGYLKWRFENNPINKYNNYVLIKRENVVSSIIIKKFNDCEFDIVEVNSLDDIYTKELLYYIIEEGKKHNIKYINMWCQLNDTMHLLVEKVGFINCEPISYFGIRELKRQNGELSIYKNWHIQMGDSDVY